MVVQLTTSWSFLTTPRKPDMPHIRKRYIESLIDKAKGLTPIIGLLGHRQVGKTTVLEIKSTGYCTLDDKEILETAQKSPKDFISSHHSKFQAIDECQLAPPLFPALKEYVRTHKKPGQFLLSGSVRFTSRKAIRESLTGRIINFELFPFTISEMAHAALPTTLHTMLEKITIEKAANSVEGHLKASQNLIKEYKYYFERGGLPGISFINNQNLRELKIKEQLLTILDRDVRMVYPTTLPFTQLLELLRFIARTQGKPFNYLEAKKITGISTATIKKILFAFEAVFLIRRIPIRGAYIGAIYFLEDQAEALYLADKALDHHDQFTHLIYRNLRAQLHYQLGSNFREFSFFSRGKSNIPYAFEKDGKILGIIPLEGNTPSRIERAVAGSFLKTYGMGRILYLHEGRNIAIIDDRSLLAPVYNFI